MTTSAGTSCFAVPPDAITSGASVSIPLEIHQLQNGGYKVGIRLTLTDPATGATASDILYEFDTGGKGFYASIPTEQQQRFPMPAKTYGQIYNHYSSGIEYFGQAVMLNVGFSQAPAIGSFPVLVGFVDQLRHESKEHHKHHEQEQPRAGQADAGGGKLQFPIFNLFYGDFGAALQASAITTGQTAPAKHPEQNESSSAQTNEVSLLTVLAQLGQPYGSGFIVDLGPYPAGAQQTGGQLILGLTDQLRTHFPLTVPMTGQPSYPPPGQAVPSTSVKTYEEAGIAGTLQIGNKSLPNIRIILDTGAPITTLHPGTVLKPHDRAQPGDQVLVTVETQQGQPVTLIDFTAGDTPSVDKVMEGGKAPETIPGGYVNTGIAAYFDKPIAFDLEQGVIRFPSR